MFSGAIRKTAFGPRDSCLSGSALPSPLPASAMLALCCHYELRIIDTSFDKLLHVVHVGFPTEGRKLGVVVRYC